MLTTIFIFFCFLIVSWAVVPAVRFVYYLIRDIVWEYRNLPKK